MNSRLRIKDKGQKTFNEKLQKCVRQRTKKKYFLSFVFPVNLTVINFKFFFLFPFSFFFCLNTFGQQFYNYEDFFKDPNYIKNHKIRSISMFIPAMEKDTNSGVFPFQKLGYNPDGQLSWYEHDRQDRKGLKKYYLWHFYDKKARVYLSKMLERCEGVDSLRELSDYFYDEKDHIIHEDHYQINVLAYNDWNVDYEWINDTTRVRHAEVNKRDTTIYDNIGRVVAFEENSWKYRMEYTEDGKIKRASYYWLNAPTTADNLIDQRIYHYNREGHLERIESDAWEVQFMLDYSGLPASSKVVDKRSGRSLGWEINYRYEMR